ncbi:TatD family hydrolase [Psychromonas sp. CD1]|uniref:TatD family hydrolase n=1 Tax=Psychromonas sp. CD1 TaxID=1979839 RepID=UPI000B9A2CDB|nr:TatD family hydrolase [Psychromonas sp. CD1]
MIDIGINLTHSRFDKDINNVIEDAKKAGIQALIVIGTNIQESKKAIALCITDPQFLYCSVGIHPHDANTLNDNSIVILRQLAEHPQVKAIGECGLDFNRNYSTPDEQEKAFTAQLALAVELQLPIFMHQRDAHRRFIDLLKPYIKKIPKAVLHCFTGSEIELEECLALGLHIGITGWVCDERRGVALLNLLKLIPSERLMIETDGPYLLPRSMRPKPKSSRNEPKYLPYIAEVIADARGESTIELIQKTMRNSQQFFNIYAAQKKDLQ